jgi:hypothetical protein
VTIDDHATKQLEQGWQHISQADFESLLEKGADPNGSFGDGTGFLRWAAQTGVQWKVDLLLKYGADINKLDKPKQKNRKPLTPLAAAIVQEKWSTVKDLLSRGADVTAKMKNVSGTWSTDTAESLLEVYGQSKFLLNCQTPVVQSHCSLLLGRLLAACTCL